MAYFGVMEDVRRARNGKRPRRTPFFALSEENSKYVAVMARTGVDFVSAWPEVARS